MAKSIKKNYIYNTLYQVLTILTPFITAPYTSRVLRADGIGKISFASSIVSYFVLITAMGTYTYGRRETSYQRDDRKKRSQVFWNLKTLTLINVVISLVIYFALTWIFAKENFTIYLILSMSIISITFDCTWLFAGMEDFSKIVFRNFVLRILNIAFLFLFVKSRDDLVLYVFAGSLFGLLGTMSLWSYLPKYIDKPDFKAINPFQDFKVIWSLFVPALALNIYPVLDKTMIGFLTGSEFENGYYEQAMKVVHIGLSFVTSLAVVVIPRISYLYGKKDYANVRKYMYRSYNFVLFLGVPLCLGMIGIADNFVPWFLGNGFEKTIGLIKIASLLIIALGINNTTGVQYLIPTGQQNVLSSTIITGSAVNAALNFVLILMFDSYGAVVASVIAECFITFLHFRVLRREFSLRKIILSGKKYYLSGICMLSALSFMGHILAPSFKNTLAMVGTGAAIYISMLFILRDEFFLEYARKFTASLAKRLHL